MQWIDDEDMNELMEGMYMRDTLDRYFDIGFISKCQYDD